MSLLKHIGNRQISGKMKSTTNNAIQEQDICKSCGFCCDRTLFSNANLKSGEKGQLPEKIEQNYFRDNDGEKFKLPCPYFDDKCTIYDQKKAIICSAYRCQLLINFSAGIISRKEAMSVVSKAKTTKEELLESFHNITGKNEVISFRELLLVLGKIQKSNNGTTSSNYDLELLIARCNIFESLLIKYFKPKKDFQEMIVVKNDKKSSK